MASPQKEHGYTAIANEIMEALSRIRIPGEARQMLDVVLRKTYGFGKKIDQISTSQFIEFTGLDKSTVYKARKRLKEMGIITVSQKGDSQIVSYSFQKDYHKWIPSLKKERVPKKGDGSLQKVPKTVSQFATHNNNKVDIQKQVDVFPFLKDDAFKTAYMAFLEMRKKIKKPTTDHAEVLILKKLHKRDIKTAILMLENSISGSWQGIFELKQQPQGGTVWKKP